MKVIETCLNRVGGWLGMGDWEPLWRGLVLGALVVVLIVVLAWLLRVMRRWRHRSHGIDVRGENGDLSITINAVREFVRRVLSEFHEVSLQGVSVNDKGRQITFNVELEVTPDADLMPLRDQIQQRILSGARERLGIESPMRVNLAVRSMEADSRKIMKADRRAIGNQTRTSSQAAGPVAAGADAEDEGESAADRPSASDTQPVPFAASDSSGESDSAGKAENGECEAADRWS